MFSEKYEPEYKLGVINYCPRQQNSDHIVNIL